VGHRGAAQGDGGPGRTVGFAVANRGAGPANLGSVVITAATARGGRWDAVAGCSAADFQVDAPSIDHGPMPAGTARTGTVRLRMVSTVRPQDACKGRDVPLFFSVGQAGGVRHDPGAHKR
jgi:hypothetical protein